MNAQSITFTDNTFTLRPMRVMDVQSMVAAAQESVTEIMPWMSWCTPAYDLKTATTWLKSLPPAWREAEKAGARPEGVLRNRLIIRERVTDAVMHALIPQDFGIPIK